MAAGRTFLMLRAILLSVLLQNLFTGSHAHGGTRQLLQETEPSFSYDERDPSGPAHWGSLNPDWQTCKTGKAQSPINLVSHSRKEGSRLGPLESQYRSGPQKVTVLKDEHSIEVDAEKDWGRIRVEGVSYQFSGLHFHSPSEHTIDNVRHELELHFVHRNEDATRIAVVGILFKVGRKESKFLEQIFDGLPENSNSSREAEVSIKGLDINKKSKYWRYKGSLTTPPCTEGVTWSVLKEVKSMSKKQWKQFQAAAPKPNSRPVQKLNGRQISSYDC